MNIETGLGQLYHYASEYKFQKFFTLFSEMVVHFSPQALQEAYLMQAQIKLYTADDTLLDDLYTAGCSHSLLRYPCLSTEWLSDGPNRLILIRKKPDTFARFCECLPFAAQRLEHWYGKTGSQMAKQLQSEIFYFQGMFDQALHLIQMPNGLTHENKIDNLMAEGISFRCHLASGRVDAAEQCMLAMVHIARNYPTCLNSYRAIRTWANLTTGWSGDTPRFYTEPNRENIPVFEDRLDAIRKGFSRMTPLESPFIWLSEQKFDDVYTLREYYMDVFQAMYWSQIGDHHQTERGFLRAYHAARSSSFIMPFVECGKQILPLLHYVSNSGISCSQQWLARTSLLAKQYDDSLTIYRRPRE